MTPREAAQKVLEGFDEGVFVRSTENDSTTGWAIRLLPYMQALVALKQFVDGEEPT